jgi:glycosyltransferase involved in cell wall biosynthesis
MKQSAQISFIRRIYINIKKFLRPQLGLLNQHAPKKLYIPKRYFKIKNKKNFPIISIVTPSFKQASFLERTLKSVLDQNYPNLEYIVQDGYSEDGSINILERYHSKLKYWTSKKDQGQSNAINLGFKHSTGEIMAYLNSDDLLLPGSLHYISDYFAKHPNVDVIYGHRILIDENDKEIGRWILPPHDSEVLSVSDFIPQETLFWRRSIWDKIGGNIDESYHFAMDWDLLLRFKEAGATFVRLPRFLGAFRVHSNQKTLTQMDQTGLKEIHRLHHRYHGRVLSNDEIKQKTNCYLKRHLLHHHFYQWGLLFY